MQKNFQQQKWSWTWERESLSNVWSKLGLPSLDCHTRETLYFLIHNKLPVKERLFRIGMENDPYCELCLEEGGTFVCDREHTFCSCSSVSGLWQRIRTIVDPILPENVSDLKLLTLNFNGGSYNFEVTWLVCTYVHEIWSLLKARVGVISHDEMFGFLKFKFKSDQLGANLKMKLLPGFS